MEIGMYFRVERDGHWQSIDICELTEDELDAVLEVKDLKFIKSLVMILVKEIQDDKRS